MWRTKVYVHPDRWRSRLPGVAGIGRASAGGRRRPPLPLAANRGVSWLGGTHRPVQDLSGDRRTGHRSPASIAIRDGPGFGRPCPCIRSTVGDEAPRLRDGNESRSPVRAALRGCARRPCPGGVSGTGSCPRLPAADFRILVASRVMSGWSAGAARPALEILAPGGSAPSGALRPFQDGEPLFDPMLRGGHAGEAPAGFHARAPATGAFATT